MLAAFESYMHDHHLCEKDEKILVAVSAGVDSMVLAELFRRGAWNIAIAHCNFQMRGADSDGDEIFVRQYAEGHNLPFHTRSFELSTYARENRLGIQEAARLLRYSWFSEVMEEQGYQHLATAHHQDDQIETVLMNISRGAGIFGLQGMSPKREHLIRPLLFASKKDILTFASEKQIESREDSSNSETFYRRNFWRNQLIPDIEARIPSFRRRMAENISIWQKTARLLEGLLQNQIEDKQYVEGDAIVFDVEKIESSLRDIIIFEWLRPYGFNYSQVQQMVEAIEEGRSGSEFLSAFNRVIVDRKRLLLGTPQEETTEEITIEEHEHSVNISDGRLEFKLLATGAIDFSQTHEEVAYFDAQKLRYPLIIRHWKSGDAFQPLGLHGKRQKVKKFFTNQKMSKLDKERQWLMLSGPDICWIIGKRIDHRFCITESTRYTMRMEWIPFK